MAVEAAGDHDCPHCPPEAMQGHHDMHGGMQAEASCADDLADCGLDDTFNHDARGGQLQLKDAQYELPSFVVAANDGISRLAPPGQRAPPPMPSGPPPVAPPVYLLNCVFLD